jgi:GNAT superfamily N-acetyltransferase
MRPYHGARWTVPAADRVDRLALETRLPTLAEYRSLCMAVGWDEALNFAAAPRALASSLWGVTVLDTTPGREQAVGMGRIVGDGAIYFYIQDIVVRPQFQGQGIGRLIMERLMGWLRLNAPEGAFVGLFAAPGRAEFYAHFGFMRHTELAGMFCVLREDDPFTSALMDAA